MLRIAWITAELVRFLASAKRRHDPYPAYDRLLRLDPVHRSPIGVWVVSRHDDVTRLLHHRGLSSNEDHIDLDRLHVGPLRRLAGKDAPGEPGAFSERAPQLMLFRDPPDHTRLRSTVNRSFTPRRVRELETRIQAIADELVAPIVAAGRTELMGEFAYPFPARVICELIGVPAGDAHHIIEPSPALAAGLDPLLTSEERRAADAATESIAAYLEHLIDRRRTDPGDDLLSALIHDDDPLGHDDLVATVLLLLVAGHETTANLLGNGLVALLDQPTALAALRADPGLDAAAVDELLRFDSPVQMVVRIATEPVDVDGRTIEPGTVVILVTGAANHDPAVFDHPERLDWHRTANPHLAFGGGIHYCLGATLARTEARIGLRTLLDRLPTIELAEPPVRRPSFTIRGLRELHLIAS